MFDLGFSELFLIALVALVVLGPQRLPKAARFAGVWIQRARSQWNSVKSEFENQLADEELKSSLRSTRDELESVKNQLKERGESLRGDFELDPDRDHVREDHARDDEYEDHELGSASDPELRAMLEPEDEPRPDALETDAPEPDLPEPEPEEPCPGEPPRRDPHPGEPERREPGTPGPVRREPPGRSGASAPDDPLDDALTGDPTEPTLLDRPDHERR